MGQDKKPEQEETKYEIRVKDHEKFEWISTQKFIDSDELCRKAVALFKSAYADLEGVQFEVNQQGKCYLALYFNHSEPEKDPAGRANGVTRVKPNNNGKKINNSTINAIRAHDLRALSGDRYYLTEEGMSGLARYIDNQCIDRKEGKVMWDKIVAETSVRQQYYGQPPIVYTKVSMIDVQKFVTEWYGEDGDNGKVIYGVDVRKSIPFIDKNNPMLGGVGGFEPKYFLAITAVDENEVLSLANKFGVTTNVGFNIIRG